MAAPIAHASSVASLDPYVDRALRRRTPRGSIVAADAAAVERFVSVLFCRVVQTCFASFVRDVGACEHCGCTGGLERAHRAGCERPQLLRHAISLVARPHPASGGIEVDAARLHATFLALHRDDGAGRRLLVLCRACHRRYDEEHKDAPFRESSAALTP